MFTRLDIQSTPQIGPRPIQPLSLPVSAPSWRTALNGSAVIFGSVREARDYLDARVACIYHIMRSTAGSSKYIPRVGYLFISASHHSPNFYEAAEFRQVPDRTFHERTLHLVALNNWTLAMQDPQDFTSFSGFPDQANINAQRNDTPNRVTIL